jgi:hypothetical protein
MERHGRGVISRENGHFTTWYLGHFSTRQGCYFVSKFRACSSCVHFDTRHASNFPFPPFLGFLSLGLLVSLFLGFSVSWLCVSWFLGFLGFWVSWFLGFWISWFLGLLVSRFLAFLLWEFLVWVLNVTL